ncbi:hypothetical protein BGZ96_011256 [Linnemannia gamsii]|uniref:F-box domain-containing protein n=1 Tax=Linnemannia gamsii TaxID=64522 RepID=A0ABQ7KBR6_9FUNG|nr:hypothetical protein BGZ96_011256 [Linnemannia gamsii]
MSSLIHALTKSHGDSTHSRSWTTALDHPYSAPRLHNGFQNYCYLPFHNHQPQKLPQRALLSPGGLSSGHTLMLDIPEVLERVLTFLNLEDRLSTRLVCKQWYAASRRLLRVQTVWQENPVPANQYHVLQGLGGIDSLTYSLRQKDYDNTPNVQVAWNRLKDRVSSGQTAFLQSLKISGPVNIQVRIAPLLPYMTSLTALHLQSVSPSSYTIALLLENCPLLRTLDIHSGPSLRPRRVQVLEAGELHGPYKLDALSLYMVCITQDSIETTIVNCPALKSLSLIDLIDPPLPILEPNATSATAPTELTTTSTTVVARIGKERLITTIGKSCLNLRHFHCSANQGQRAMVSPMSLFTNLRSLGLPAQTICPELVTIIQGYTNVLTSLTIEGSSDNNAELSDSLYRYLCSTAARHLKQLDAPHVYLDDRLLNLKVTIPPTPVTPTAINAPPLPTSFITSDKIWTCRDLISLHISFGTQDNAARNLAESSRIIFGYLSQVCPRLQHLKICRDAIDCSLDGGLCLLSELGDLRTLEIKTTTLAILNLWDFGWLDNEPTVLQRLADKMSLNDSRVQRSLRSRYEWLGCKDSRHVDQQRLELLGLIPSLSTLASPSAPSLTAPTSRTITSPNQHQHLRHQRTLSNDSRPIIGIYRHHSYHSRSHSYNGRMEPVNSPRRWPHLERFTIRQTNDRRNQAQNIHGFIKKRRPDLTFDL